jgi:hypothetical protein
MGCLRAAAPAGDPAPNGNMPTRSQSSGRGRPVSALFIRSGPVIRSPDRAGRPTNGARPPPLSCDDGPAAAAAVCDGMWIGREDQRRECLWVLCLVAHLTFRGCLANLIRSAGSIIASDDD